MGTPYIGEIRTVGFSFAPPGWLSCSGQTVSISDYETLFNLIGTTYGGDGQTNFMLPNLQSRVAIHQGTDGSGNTYSMGVTGGQESVTLNAITLGSHAHLFKAGSGNGSAPAPTNALPAISLAGNLYVNDATNNVVAFANNAIAPTGSNGAHNNVMPYQCINFIIATEGIYPSPN